MTKTPDPRPDEATLEELRAAVPAARREPALGYPAVEAWEAENGVTLPEPYRSFVAEVSNGSAPGPRDAGLQPLGQLPACWAGGEPRRPDAVFPLEDEWIWEDDEYPEDDESAEHDQDARIDAVFSRGSIVLCAQDTQAFWLLVTTGRQRGRVWLVADVGASPAPDGEPAGFAQWLHRRQAGDGGWG
ncbi:SMI1/KNR4 family protein [Streptomyces erythrochromogenes]|uniref:SMI1/KNR4 family protein n=1 Tax=Streptomyces erythrochromogenes TaxID=285574 RepID=UPI0038656B76|nr:SMI1/KNR4 family protein [Streptomyces erythrochromogenes]